jgi:hypothetical protein
MLGYKVEDIDNMIDAIDTALIDVDDTNDPWLHGTLHQTKSLLEGLLAEGHIND